MRQDALVEPISKPPRLVPGRLRAATNRLGPPFRASALWPCLWLTVLVLCFGPSLLAWVRYAWDSELYSYTLGIPIISLYLAWRKAKVDWRDCERVHWFAILPLAAGLGGLGASRSVVWRGLQASSNDQLALEILALVFFAVSGGLLFLSTESLRRAKFPMAFLMFMVPLPDAVRSWLESFLQHRSADAAQLLFAFAGMPALRHGTVFHLPGFSLKVAPECSGIHSTLVLFITSLVAGYLLLQSPWRRVLLALSVIPLALLRNGFRIFTIGELCVNVSPDMINSYIHRRGGPIFFALSLIPFFLLLLYLRKGEHSPPCGPAVPTEKP